MSHIGPAVVFPLGAHGSRRGVLTIGRRHGAGALPAAEASFAASFAAQAGVALELAASRAEAERLSVFQDRDRIARDLHDLVIQRLYATGMSLQGTMPMISRPEVADRVTRAVDRWTRPSRRSAAPSSRCRLGTPRSGDDPRADIVALVEEMTEMLGFAPSLRLGPGLRTLDSEELAEQALIVLREALSNMARHAGATRADVTVDVDSDGILTVTVTDNGTGIPPDGQAQRAAQPRRPRRRTRRRAAAEPGRARMPRTGNQAGMAGPDGRPASASARRQGRGPARPGGVRPGPTGGRRGLMICSAWLARHDPRSRRCPAR